MVTWTETPASGSVFAGWSGGGCSGVGTSCLVPMSSAASVTATFNIGPPQTLSVGLAWVGFGGRCLGRGGISCPGTCSGSESLDTVVTLTETPAVGSVFVGWSGGRFGAGASCQVTMSSAKSVTATFNAGPPQTLSVVLAGSGSGSVSGWRISCPGTCSGSESLDTVVTLTETAASGSVFAGWSGGGCTGVGTTCQVTLSAAAPVTATFTASARGSGQALAPELRHGVANLAWVRYDHQDAPEGRREQLLLYGGSQPEGSRSSGSTPPGVLIKTMLSGQCAGNRSRVVVATLSAVVRSGVKVRLKLKLTGPGRSLLEHATGPADADG